MTQTLGLLPYVTLFFLMLTTSSSLDTLAVFGTIRDGETIVSKNGIFELGFFSPGSSKNRYLGIWFKNSSPHTVVWVANREAPLINTSGMVKLESKGTLSLVNDSGTVIWSSGFLARTTNANPIAQLLHNGNLVIKDDENGVIWQSFDYPGDTFLSGMKLGKNLETGREMYQTSWRSDDDPSPGEYTVRFLMVKGKYPQVYIWKNSVIKTRIGPYDGIELAGQANYRRNGNHMYNVGIVVNEKEMYFWHTSSITTYSLRIVATPGGKVEFSVLNNHNKEWKHDYTFPMDVCDNYGLCGPYGSCNTDTFPSCACLKGFEQKNPEELSSYNLSSGCRRSRALDCGQKEGFLKFSSIKLPDTQNALFNGSMSLKECEIACKVKCSCTAYANPNATKGGVGCLLWFGALIDIRVYQQNGQQLFVRLAASELLEGNTISLSSFFENKTLLTVVLSTLSFVVLLFTVVVYVRIKKKRRSHIKERGNSYGLHKKNSGGQIQDLDELPFYSLQEIAKATDNFSINNKIGEGGFGPVYRGVFKDGKEVAVKRLSDSSQQGLDEFKNEVICIAKLQHRNLVKLLGYCIHGNEMILIYEYMANKSLDTFLFDEIKSSLLNWPRRFHIIHGLARGILYLHQDSRLQIIHRDLKAGNILLDGDMNPKISDFGLARMFEGSDNASKTKKVVGTYGYMSPEYAVHGRFSIKSDVFSFGVLVLEIVSGKKNKEFLHEDHSDNLLGYAWRLYKDDKSIELMSASLRATCVVTEVVRSIHVALLCVQHHAEDRPTMLSVVLMLVSEGVLPQPKQPAFFTGESRSELQSVSSVHDQYTITQVYAR